MKLTRDMNLCLCNRCSRLAQDRLYMAASITGGGRTLETLRRTTNPQEATDRLSHIPTLAKLETRTHADRSEMAVIQNGTRDSNQPGSLFSTSSIVNNRGSGTEAPPQGQGIVPQEPASRGRGVPVDIKQENEKLWKMIKCIVCIDKCRCVVFLPCAHMVLCSDCSVHVEKVCPVC